MSISLSSLLGSPLRFAPSIILPIMISACGTMACLLPTPPPGAMAPIPAPVPLTPTPSPTSMSPVSTLTLSLISNSTRTAGLPSKLGSNGILRLLPGISDDQKTWMFRLVAITKDSKFYIDPDVSLYSVSHGDMIYAVLMANVTNGAQGSHLFIAVMDCNKMYFQMWGRLNGRFVPLSPVTVSTAWEPGPVIDGLMKYGSLRPRGA